jgi:hopanoid biosynthesis associated protein HpnK
MPARPSILVVNADDFGISRGVNRGIVEAYRNGLVTSASLMANLPSAEDALTRAAVCPDLGLGLHLTLTAGRPLLPPADVQSLVDEHGRFLVLGTFLSRLSTGKVRTDDVRRELTAQVEWANRHGLQPGHLDSHHHVHVHPLVAPVVVRIAREFGVGWVRCPVETLGPGALLAANPTDVARTVAISAFGLLLRARLRRSGLRSADQFRGIGLGMGFDQRALIETLRVLPSGLTELMTHPGHPDEELRRLTVFAEGRDRELLALTSGAAREAVRSRGVRISAFPEAHRSGVYT